MESQDKGPIHHSLRLFAPHPRRSVEAFAKKFTRIRAVEFSGKSMGCFHFRVEIKNPTMADPQGSFNYDGKHVH